METIVQRLKQYLEFKDIAVSLAEKEIGISNGSLSKPFNSNTTIKTDNLEKFLKKYSDINPEWLLTGKEPMLKSELKKEDKPSTEATNIVELDQLRKENAMQAKIIELQSEKIATLEQRLAQEKSNTRGVLVPAVAEPAPQLIKNPVK